MKASNHPRTYQFLKFAFGFMLVGGLFSCSKKKEDSELQSQISITVSSPEYVLPNTLTNVINDADDTLSVYYTCNDSGSVAGPRVRIRKITLNWTGTGKLLPLLIQIKSEDQQLPAKFTTTISPVESSTLAHLFGLGLYDYIPQGVGIRSNEDTGTPGTAKNSRCYMDLGGMPTPKTLPTGSGQVKIQARLIMSSLVETTDENGNPFFTPVIKEIPFQFVYIDGSVIP